jgi:hypothetical protein
MSDIEKKSRGLTSHNVGLETVLSADLTALATDG